MNKDDYIDGIDLYQITHGGKLRKIHVMSGTIKDIWEKVDTKDQEDVNTSLRNTMMIVGPAIEQMWKLNLKVNILYGVISFIVVGGGLWAAIYSAVKK